MATNRSRRLRKKLCLDEFQELGCELSMELNEGLEGAAKLAFFKAFLREAIEANGLGYVGGEDYGFVCLAKRGSVSQDQRIQVEAWLSARSELKGFTLSPLLDVWYPENSVPSAS